MRNMLFKVHMKSEFFWKTYARNGIRVPPPPPLCTLFVRALGLVDWLEYKLCKIKYKGDEG